MATEMQLSGRRIETLDVALRETDRRKGSQHIHRACFRFQNYKVELLYGLPSDIGFYSRSFNPYLSAGLRQYCRFGCHLI